MLEWIYENIIALVAVFISGITALYSYFQGRKGNTLQEEQTELQRRVVELEEKRAEEKKLRENSANIEAKIQYEDTGISKIPYKLVVENVGMKAAENVRIYVNEKPPSESDLIYVEGQKDVLPVLQPADPYYYVFGGEVDNVDFISVNISFDDPMAEGKEYKMKLGL